MGYDDGHVPEGGGGGVEAEEVGVDVDVVVEYGGDRFQAVEGFGREAGKDVEEDSIGREGSCWEW